ncbi:hypothetical protein BS47DRAFT_1399085 [Hydnum rufescens UP504]|uniref:Uncharacterized protein n=1 Tax=Hydnum rufescens UP504 TaxID=1448309 RepID=A0A9P6AJI7_9AGAM|nr:hypothetical protein BS47DRAFT_1399085 [Hydnum rufescens UP504]
MTKPSYFALVGIETLTLQELLACWARWNGLSPMDWTNPLEPEPPPSSGPSPLLNSDTTELTLVECVRTPLAGPYRTAHGSNLTPSSSFYTPLDANIRGLNIGKSASRSSTALPSVKDWSPGTAVSKQAHRPLIDGILSPLSNRVDTSRRVVTPLNLCCDPGPPHILLSDTSVARRSNVHLDMQSSSHPPGYNNGLRPVPSMASSYRSNEASRTIHHNCDLGTWKPSLPPYKAIWASLCRSNKFDFSRAMNIISTWLDWLLYDLDVDSRYFLDQVTSDFPKGSLNYMLDSTLAHVILHCRDVLQEVAWETTLFQGLTCAPYSFSLNNYERAHLLNGTRSLSSLQYTVTQAQQHLRSTSDSIVCTLQSVEPGHSQEEQVSSRYTVKRDVQDPDP